MSDIAIKVEKISKQYRLGTVSTGTLSHDLNRWWYKVRGKEDPYLQVGGVNDRTIADKNEYVWALKDIDFEIKQGESVGIIGKNGAGKSTLLKIISQVTAPTTGNIKIKGRIAALLEVGTGFHPELTGRENIFLNGAILGMTKSEIKSKLDEIIDFAGVAKYVDTPVKRYSSGMLVRLGFAVAAHLEPEIMIVDEVLAVGDAEFQKKCLGKMNDVNQKEGRTVLFVSHQMGAIRDLCRSVIWMKNGVIGKTGDTNELIKLYLEENISRQQIKLSERKDRRGKGKIMLEDIIIYDYPSFKRIDTIITGENVVFEFKYKSLSDDQPFLNDVTFGFAIHTKDEQFLTPLNNGMALKPFESIPASGSVFCKVENFPFIYGDFMAHAGLIVKNELEDYVERAVNFSVESGDYFKTGNPNAHKRSGIYINQAWSTLKF